MKKTAIVLALLLCQSAFAKFDEVERSINNTAETLNSGRMEVGLGSFHYGVTDSLTLSTYTVPTLIGLLSVDARYKFKVSETWRITPYAGAGYFVLARAPMGNVGVTAGFDFGEKRKNSFSFGAGAGMAVAYSSDLTNTSNVRETVPILSGRLMVEYDRYTDSGNLFYVGLETIIPYVGFTWAWENVHFGLVSSLASLFIPLPYFYFRF